MKTSMYEDRKKRSELASSEQGGGHCSGTCPGFTLMEILIALSIVAIIFSTLFAVFDKVIDVALAVDRRSKLAQEARLCMLQIQRDFMSLVLPDPEQSNAADSNSSEPLPLTGQSLNTDFFSEDKTVLSLSTWSSLNLQEKFPKQEIHVVIYTVEASENQTEGFSLFRTERELVKTVSPETRPQENRLLLSSHLESLSISFYEQDQGLVLSSWTSDPADKNQSTRDPPAWVSLDAVFVDQVGTRQRFAFTYQIAPLPQTERPLPDVFPIR